MSGTAYGTVVLHVSPESAIGGNLGLVQNGDMIELDVPNKKFIWKFLMKNWQHEERNGRKKNLLTTEAT
jgi:dihydroxyacid dehydratase/phosphogluconate dehydratase